MHVDHINLIEMLVLLGLTEKIKQLTSGLQLKIKGFRVGDQYKKENTFYDWVAQNNFFSILSAAEDGHLTTLILLKDVIPWARLKGVFIKAAKGGHLDIMQYVVGLSRVSHDDWLTPDEWILCFKEAASREDNRVCHYLVSLEILPLLVFLKQNDEKYGSQFLQPYFDKKLAHLVERKEAYDKCLVSTSYTTLWERPRFDMKKSDASIGHLIAQYLIAQVKKEDVQDEVMCLAMLEFLMTIPNIRRLSAINNNELLFSALRLNHMPFATYLFNVPEVRHKIWERDLYAPKSTEEWKLLLPLLKEDNEFSDRAHEIDEMAPVKASYCRSGGRLF